MPTRVVFALVWFSLFAVAGQAQQATKPSSPGTDDSRPSLAREVGEDFKRLFTSRENLIVLGAGVAGTWAARPFDDRVATSGLNSELYGDGALDVVFESGEIGGGSYAQFGLAFATWGAGKLGASERVEAIGRDLVRAQIVTQSVTFGLKKAFGRERPDGSSRTSFPSGHTSGSFATATVLARHMGVKAAVPAYAFASYVAVSRLNEGRHYLSDVVFGAALGLIGGRTVTVHLGDERFALAPLVVRGGGGVQLTWVGEP